MTITNRLNIYEPSYPFIYFGIPFKSEFTVNKVIKFDSLQSIVIICIPK